MRLKSEVSLPRTLMMVRTSGLGEKVPVNVRWFYLARINAWSLVLSVPSDISGDKEGQIPVLGIVLCIAALASVWR